MFSLVWFWLPVSISFVIQLTDIHLSSFDDRTAEPLIRFCSEISSYGPHLKGVIITGDLVDAVPPLFSTAVRGQFKQDWSLLSKAMHSCIYDDSGHERGIPIIAIRGNHDCFGVDGFGSNSNEGFIEFQRLLQASWHGQKIQRDERGNLVWFLHDEPTAIILLDGCDPQGSPHQFYANFVIPNIKIPADYTQIVLFSHYTTGSYLPKDRSGLFDWISTLNKEHANRVRGFFAGHWHRFLGYTLSVRHIGSGNFFLDEFETPDLLGSGIVRVIGGEDWGVVLDMEIGKWESAAIGRDGGMVAIVLQKSLFSEIIKPKINGKLPGGLRGGLGRFVCLKQENAFFRETQREVEISKSGKMFIEGDPNLSFEPIQFSDPSWLRKLLLTRFPEMAKYLMIATQLATVLFSGIFWRFNKSKFSKINFALSLVTPACPLLVLELPNSFAFVFLWGSVPFKFPVQLLRDDLAGFYFLIFQLKAIVLICLYWLINQFRKFKFNTILLEIVIGLAALGIQIAVHYFCLKRCGPIGLVNYSLIWDIAFWAGVLLRQKQIKLESPPTADITRQASIISKASLG